jgi:lysophospholipase L1-like esterase
MSLASFMAVSRASTASPDKYDLTASDTHNANGNGAYSPNGVYPGFKNTNGRTLVDATLIGGQKTLVIIVAGQSNCCSVSPTPYVATNALSHGLNIYDGGVYKMQDPLLGSSHTPTAGNPPLCGSWVSRLGDKLIAGGVASRVIMVPAAMAGSWIGDHDPAVTPMNNYQRIQVALRRCATLGYTPDAIIWHQGENDSGSGTPQATYQAILGRIIAQSRTDGYAGPWFIDTVSWNNGTPSAAIQAAQAAVVNHAAGIWAGANADSLDNSFRQPDMGHFSDVGMDAVASLAVTALHAYGAPF